MASVGAVGSASEKLYFGFSDTLPDVTITNGVVASGDVADLTAVAVSGNLVKDFIGLTYPEISANPQEYQPGGQNVSKSVAGIPTLGNFEFEAVLDNSNALHTALFTNNTGAACWALVVTETAANQKTYDYFEGTFTRPSKTYATGGDFQRVPVSMSITAIPQPISVTS